MTLRFGGKFDDLSGSLTVRAVEDGRTVAEIEAQLVPFDALDDVYRQLLDEGEDLSELYGEQAGAAHLAEAARLQRCGEAHGRLEDRLGGRFLDDIFMVETDETGQLDESELARLWRIVVRAAGQHGAVIWAPACTWFITGERGDSRLGKVWKRPDFRAGLQISGPVAYQQPALAAAANPKQAKKRKKPKQIDVQRLTHKRAYELVEAGVIPKLKLEAREVERFKTDPYRTPTIRTRHRTYMQGANDRELTYGLRPDGKGKRWRLRFESTPPGEMFGQSGPIKTVKGVRTAMLPMYQHAVLHPGLGAPGKDAAIVCSSEVCHAWDPHTGRHWTRRPKARNWYQVGTKPLSVPEFRRLFQINVGRYKELGIPYSLEGEFPFDTSRGLATTRAKRKKLVRAIGATEATAARYGMNPPKPDQAICTPWICAGFDSSTGQRFIKDAGKRWTKTGGRPGKREAELWELALKDGLGKLRELWAPYYLEGDFPFDVERDLPVSDAARKELWRAFRQPRAANRSQLRSRLVR